MPSVLITGAARGIGRSIAIHLAANGWEVFAGVRTDDDAAAIAMNHPITPVILDITDADHLAALDSSLPESLDAVVNNAGVLVYGPLEALSLAELRRQFEVNVFGQIAVTQAVLPRLRRAQGRIVLVSSLTGKVALPLIGAYCASKFALEAAGDVLRMELKRWNIAVALIEAGATDTDMCRNGHDMLDDAAARLSAEHRELYEGHFTGLNNSLMSQMTAAPVPPEKVAAVVVKALTARRPRDRYFIAAGDKLQQALMTQLPATARDWVLRRVTNQPGSSQPSRRLLRLAGM
ncbi:SDR family oxidoreductase [Mycobacterium haemophilum]|uniref:Retinol dehydrogenase n=1 Tax=Mycobacterium haemophilum TaxID=29311 RepID=A0A0I9UL56_9MYCO|nr:SDR family oxidoreductase [Mycobacterium haemophilum]AKN18716.1 retinol dehydrogenase [Mycobacterium haemophilum DSM 44634]KLO32928.1 retinol dehydrogenase [Mycobacterium haemophilum]KLO37231.1 retinol dehydrogenase [Mycobacterium haemophilum]KLO43704.1 retinol dehydrogenase [Mycobacterium haemophilum]KLO56061.1 retinol dehydrogenase [Mycobacterium haemophilum]